MQPVTFSQSDDLVKENLVSQLSHLVDPLLAMARNGASMHTPYVGTWTTLGAPSGSMQLPVFTLHLFPIEGRVLSFRRL